MNSSKELVIMRVMAWERAKGEIYSILASYYEYDDDVNHYAALLKTFKKFVADVEENGLLR